MAKEQEFFDEVLQALIEASGMTIVRLADISGVPCKTIESWLEGRVKRPRECSQLLRVGKAMRLSHDEVNRLLVSARQKPVKILLEDAHTTQDQAVLALLTFWSEPQQPVPESTPNLSSSIFQAPPALTKLVGRAKEFETVKNVLLSGGQVCVLRGMSGVGKTELATKVANELRSAFPDGVLWGQVDKSGVDAILRSFASAFAHDVSECADEATLIASVRDLFAHKKALVILDGVYSDEPLHALLPPTTGGSAVLVTTTNHKLLVNQALLVEIKPFTKEDSLTLFQTILGDDERAKEAQLVIEKIMHLVGGLPLALKMVASNLANTQQLTISEYYELLLDERTRRDEIYQGEEISRNARLSFEVSYRLLRERWQKLVACLSLFKGIDFSLEAVAAAVDCTVEQAKLDLGHLHALSLIEESRQDVLQKPTTVAGSQTNMMVRYRQHALLAFFGAEKLQGEFATLRVGYQQRLAAYYAGVAQRNKDSHAILEKEWGNLVAALPWLVEADNTILLHSAVDALTNFKLGVAGFLDAQGHWRAAVHLLELLHSAPHRLHDPLVYALLNTKLAIFSLRLAQRPQTEQYLSQAFHHLAESPESRDAVLCKAYAYDTHAQFAWAQGQPEVAATKAQQGITALARFQSQQRIASSILSNVEGYLLIRHATILARMGEVEQAQPLLSAGLQKLPSYPSVARISALLTLGNIFDIQGEAAQAHKYFQEGVEVATALGDKRRLADLRRNLAIHAEEEGNFVACESQNQQARDLYQQIGDIAGVGYTSSNLSVNYLRQGRLEEAYAAIDKAMQVAEERDLLDLRIYARVNLAHYHLLCDEIGEASQLLEQVHWQCEEAGEMEVLAEILRLQAQLALKQADYRHALQLLDQSIQTADENELEASASWRLKGEILSALGDCGEAEAAFAQSLALSANHPFDHDKTQTALKQHHEYCKRLDQNKQESVGTIARSCHWWRRAAQPGLPQSRWYLANHTCLVIYDK